MQLLTFSVIILCITTLINLESKKMNLKFALEQVHAKESERPKLPIKLHQSNKFINKKLTSIYICQGTKEKIYKIKDYLKITVDDVINMLIDNNIHFGASK